MVTSDDHLRSSLVSADENVRARGIAVLTRLAARGLGHLLGQSGSYDEVAGPFPLYGSLTGVPMTV